MQIKQEDSLLYQSIAICRLLFELHHSKFLESDFYKVNCFKNGNSVFKEILSHSGGIGNPATLQTMLYLLLVCPRELLDDVEKKELDNEINSFCNTFKPDRYETTYGSDKCAINFSKHLRNAVAHSLCKYPNAGEFIFRDNNPNNTKEIFEIRMSSYDVESILEIIQNKITSFLNKRNHPKK